MNLIDVKYLMVVCCAQFLGADKLISKYTISALEYNICTLLGNWLGWTMGYLNPDIEFSFTKF